MSDHDELKRLAEAATPGPWYARDYGSYDGNGSHWFLDTQSPHDIVDDQDGGFSPNHWDDARGERDMKFIAAANPGAILELLAEIERLKGGQGEAVGQIRADLERSCCIWFGPTPPHGTNLYTSQPAPVSVKPVAWRIPVNGDWFYGTKEQCEREYAEYTADFTAEDFDEAGPVTPEPLACLDKVKELNQ